jgi:hypothetical protein
MVEKIIKDILRMCQKERERNEEEYRNGLVSVETYRAVNKTIDNVQEKIENIS